MRIRHIVCALAGLTAFTVLSLAAARAGEHVERSPMDEVIYFVLPDRFENGDPTNDTGGYGGDALTHGFDPTHKGFYHGGDLRGLIDRLDYIEDLGATAIWFAPIYKNKPVQGIAGLESAGYHGYWVTDFTQVDPHFGTNEELKAFIDAAHARGMKVYFDIITNHTADVIAYRECYDPTYQGDDKIEGRCEYRSKADYPFSTRGDTGAESINDGFQGIDPPFQTIENFERLKRADFAYTPFITPGEESVKVPAWLNDPIYYHNRGETTFEGENSLFGDFFGLDDLQTEDPRVVSGFIDIYRDWVETYKIDGFRIDTARHVNPEFWQAFAPAILEAAANAGIPNFYMFGEVYDPDPGSLARHTRVDGLPTVLDFAFQDTLKLVVAEGEPTSHFETLFAADALYEGGAAAALQLPTFLGNHDMGRFAYFVREGSPDANDNEVLKKVVLGHAMMFFMRGAPVIYYGDEQGFIGDGNDQDARQNMFASAVSTYNDDDLIGTNATTKDINFDQNHPIYKAIKDMARIYHAHAPLRSGSQILRKTELDGGLVAISRTDNTGGEYLVVFNTRDEKRTAQVKVDTRSNRWSSVAGRCPKKSTAPGSAKLSIGPLSYAICKSNSWTK